MYRLSRGELITEISQWDADFNPSGYTKPMMQAVLKEIYVENAISKKEKDTMPSLSKLRKAELQGLCDDRKILYLPKDTVGELQLKIRKYYQDIDDAMPSTEGTVTFGKHRGLSHADLLQNHREYCQWMVNAERAESHKDMKKLVRWLRDQGVLPVDKFPNGATSSTAPPTNRSTSRKRRSATTRMPMDTDDRTGDSLQSEQLGEIIHGMRTLSVQLATINQRVDHLEKKESYDISSSAGCADTDESFTKVKGASP